MTREYPASIGQRLMWFLEHYRSADSSVSCPAIFRVRGDLEPHRVQQALALVSSRHESLRTTLRRRARSLVQQVEDDLPVVLDHEALPASESERLDGLLAAELRRRIDVEDASVRFLLWSAGAHDHVLCVNMHHLVSDAWSCAIVIDEVIEALRAPPGAEPDLPPPGWQYHRFCEWQQEQESSGELAAHVEYWTGKLRGMTVLDPPRAGQAGSTDRPLAALATTVLPGDVGDALRSFARAQHTTLFSVMLALYYFLLYRMTGATDLAVSSLFANRTRVEVKRTVGFLANMLVLRTGLEPEGSFQDLLTRTRTTVLEAVVHQAVPCHMLPLGSLLASPGRIDDVVFQMLPDRRPDAWAPRPLSPGTEAETVRPNQGMSRFGLNLTVIPRADRVDARLSYAANRYPPAWAERFLGEFAALTRLVLASSEISLAALARTLDATRESLPPAPITT